MKDLGRVLGLPDVLTEKIPLDGLSGKTDEDNLGFTYLELDHYIRTGQIENTEKRKKINELHQMNLFKLNSIPAYDPQIPQLAK